MTTDNGFIEQQIIEAVRQALTERINENLRDMRFAVSPIEYSDYCGDSAVIPSITLSSCERTEKERIVRLDAYSLTVTFSLPETPESEKYCFAYSGAVSRAIYDNPTLGGIADRIVVTGKKYLSPKKPNCGEGWSLVISLRVTVEGMGNAG
jgi:hypothetical protein